MSQPTGSLTNETHVLPQEATWEELSMVVDSVGTLGLGEWIDESLAELLQRFESYITPKSHKKSLCSDRRS